MKPYQMLDELNEAGLEAGGDYHDGIEGYFEWSVKFENGSPVLTIVFVDYADVDWDKSGRDNEMPRYESSWVLTPKKEN